LVTELCNDPRCKGKTRGVISLQGEDQADLINNLLREAIGEEEMVRRRIICGDSKFFQGDGRDVMFLSMVACSEPRPVPMTRKPDEQKFNVAASRARDQMRLFHSVRLEDLKPNDMRYRLLAYCMDPTRTQVRMESAADRFSKYGSSNFHQEVYRLIGAKGYRAIPEYVVGTHPSRIDIVGEGMRGRLAVECDGDKWHGIDVWGRDMERQTVLERVGWRFWRVKASDFYFRREKAMDGLWSLLDEPHIEPCNDPTGPDDTNRQWVPSNKRMEVRPGHWLGAR